jgi:hypothetical protein
VKKNKKAFGIWIAVSALTIVLFVFGDMDVGWQRLLPAAWGFFSWNFFAYAAERDMWPWIFVELEGHDKGYPPAREAMFWFTAALYLGLLATITWAK